MYNWKGCCPARTLVSRGEVLPWKCHSRLAKIKGSGCNNGRKGSGFIFPAKKTNKKTLPCHSRTLLLLSLQISEEAEQYEEMPHIIFSHKYHSTSCICTVEGPHIILLGYYLLANADYKGCIIKCFEAFYNVMSLVSSAPIWIEVEKNIEWRTTVNTNS